MDVCASTKVPVSQIAKDVFPGLLYTSFLKFQPSFPGVNMNAPADCLAPDPRVYFSNTRGASDPLFHNEQDNFPMATNYMDSSRWSKPRPEHYQTVLGFAEMQWPYYQYLGDMKPDDGKPYLVISMDANIYQPYLNFKFVECGLLGWPGFPLFQPDLWPIRLVLKNPVEGKPCVGAETGHAWCNLATSWGTDPNKNSWRATANEVNALIHLCTKKYKCDVQKAVLVPPPGKQAPQIFQLRVLRDANGVPLPADPDPDDTAGPLNI
jgi:hypothetical protein